MNTFSIYCITHVLALLLLGPKLIGQTQRVGIGTVQPQEALDVNGAVRIGSTTGLNAGTIRWNQVRHDFEGYNGNAWVSLTGSKGNWGRQEDLVRENDGTTFTLLDPGSGHYGRGVGSVVSMTPDVILCGTHEDYGPAGQVNAGSVHLIRKNGTAWNSYPNYTLYAPAPQAAEHYGYAVATSGARAVVGGTGWNDGRGRIHIYDIPVAGQPVHKATFSNSGGSGNDHFGNAVGISGDHILVGVPNKDVSGNTDQGQVIAYKYNLANQTWYVAQYLHHPEPAANDLFGSVIDIDFPYAVIGVPNKTAGGHAQAGKVYVYQYSGGWNLQQVLEAPAPEQQDAFGKSLALRSDTLVVGMPQAGSTDSIPTGKVFVFVRNGNTWTLQATIVPEGSTDRIQFGASVDAVDGTLVAGAPAMRLSMAESAGQVFVYKITGGTWIPEARLSSDIIKAHDAFGRQVKLEGNAIVVGAPNHDVGEAVNGGRLFYYYKD